MVFPRFVRRTGLLPLCLGLALVLALPGRCLCDPGAVTLYPDGALLQGKKALSPVEPGRVQLTLPIHAREDTLRLEVIRPAEASIADIRLQKVKRVDSGAVHKLQEELAAARSQRAALQDRKRSLRAVAGFWETQSQARPESIEDAKRLAGLVRSELEAAYSEISALEEDLVEVQERIRALQDRLDALTGKASRVWQVELTLDQPAREEVLVRYAYHAGSCGWTPFYRLNALPGSSEVEFTWQARVWQETGMPWEDAALELATAQAETRLEPPELKSWVIRPRPQARVGGSAADRAMSLAAPHKAGAGGSEPRRREGFLFDTYELGRISLRSGESTRLAVREELFAAEFDYLVRPHRSGRAFLRAHLDLQEDIHYPEGQALFLLDSASLGKRPFSLFKASEPLYFGTDPHLSVSVETLDKKSGQKGLFGKTKSYAWFWRVTLENGKDRAIQVRVEDAAPQVRDERIELQRHFPGPAPSLDGHTAAWDLALAAGETASLEYGYSLEYPAEMELSFGGR